MDKERSCFVLKTLQKSWLLSWSSPAPCLFVWQHQVTMVTGRLRGAGETQIIIALQRAQPFLTAIPPQLPRKSSGVIRGLYSSCCRSFLAGACKSFLICTTWHEDPHCVFKKQTKPPNILLWNVQHGMWILPKDALVVHFKCKIDIKKPDRAVQTSFSSKMQY